MFPFRDYDLDFYICTYITIEDCKKEIKDYQLTILILI